MIGAILFTLATSASQAAPPTNPLTAVTVDPARVAKARQLAQLLNPESSLIDDSGDDYVTSTTQLLKARGKLDALEARYPGIIAAMLRASVPTVNAQMHRRVPVLWNRLADIYLATFVGPELDQMLAFYGSSTGRKMIASLNSRIRPKAMTGDMIKHDDLSISLDAFRSDLKDAVPGVVSDMGPQDRTALLSFMQTAAFKKIALNVGNIQKVALDWAQEETPEGQAELQAVMTGAMKAYIKTRDAEAAPKT